MITIITVNWNSYDWLDLLLESLNIFTTNPYKVIVVDNSIINPHRINRPNVFQILNKKNIGHGEGLNLGANHPENNNPFTLFLDVDCHVLSHKWDLSFIELMKNFDVVGGKGVPQKPIRPACMFMKTEIAQKYDWSATPGYNGVRSTPNGADVAIKGFYQMQKENVPIYLLESTTGRYGTLNGEEFGINGKSLIYHNWSGTWLKERQKDFPKDDLFEDKRKLFSKIPWRIL